MARKMPKQRADFRGVSSGGSSTAPAKETPAQEAERMGKQHMAVAANKAREALAASSEGKVDDGFMALMKKVNPFRTAAKTLGGK